MSQRHYDIARVDKKYAGILLFALVLVVYLSVRTPWWSGDTLPTSYLPISILKHGNLHLDYFPSLYDAKAMKAFPHGHTQLPYYLSFRRGHYVSDYPPWPALLAVPVYIVPVLDGAPETQRAVLSWAKWAASIITAFSVLFLFLALTEVASVGWAVAIALVYALGTSAFSVSSQALWQHGPSALFLTLGLFFLIKGAKEESKLPYAGLCFSIAVMMRYTDAVIALALALYIAHKHRRQLLRYLVISSLPAFPMLAYNYLYLGSFTDTGYFRIGSNIAGMDWRSPFWQGLSGLVVSPSRGLFVYSPILILSLFGIWLVWRNGPISLRYLSVGLLLVILVCSKWYMWWGGYGYGPRLLADIAPLFCFFLYPLESMAKKQASVVLVFALLASLSFSMHAIGAYWYDGRWDAQAQVWTNRNQLWSWENSPFVYYGHYPYWDAGQLAHDLGIRREIHTVLRHVLHPFKKVQNKQAFGLPPKVVLSPAKGSSGIENLLIREE